MQSAISRALENGEHRLVWQCSTASDGLRRLDADLPDVLLVDATLSDLSCTELTRRALAKHQVPILLLSESEQDTVADVYAAMQAGAVDVVMLATKTRAGREQVAERLHPKLRTVRRLLGHSSGKMPSLAPKNRNLVLVALGASTGGPQALLDVLSRLPKGFPGAIVIVQHVDSEFSEGLASWLAQGSGLRVEIARAGVMPTAGVAFLAGLEDHLIMAAGCSFRYTAEPTNIAYRPSVDVLFKSIAAVWRGPCVAALLTGMGRDGADGLRKMRDAGFHTLAQDEASSVVYGMPKAAAQINAAVKVLPPSAIAAEIADYVSRRTVFRTG
jgi:two-component system response regulator WspF